MGIHTGKPLSIGSLFGKWKVLELVPKEQRPKPGLQYICECQCPNRTISRVFASDIRRGKSSQCKPCGGYAVLTHSGAKTPEYRAWVSLRARCENPTHSGFKNYGGRGIKVDPQWLPSGGGFPQFLKDMGPRPTKNHSIHRVNNDGPYAPGNCVWATPAEQARGRRTNRLITHKGRTQILLDWLREVDLSPAVFRSRCRAGWPEDVAATTPHVKDAIKKALELLDQNSEVYQQLKPFSKHLAAVLEVY